MKFTTVALSAAISTSVLAYPGMGGSMSDLHSHMQRQSSCPTEMIGDLGNSNLGPVGQEVKDCLLETVNGNCEVVETKTYVPPGPLGSSSCAADTCCVWDFVAKDLVALFVGSDGQCTEDARTAIRLGFHDAGAWSKTSGFGGADGSMLLNAEEPTRGENKGLEEIIVTGQGLLAKYKSFGVGAADLVQFMATVATVSCPLGPRVLTLVGRSDNAASPTGLLPGVFFDSTTIISLFEDKTICPDDLAALVGAHSTSAQDIVDPARAGAPQDSTPGVWDVKFYTETVDQDAPAELFKFASDVALSKDPATAPSFALFGNSAFGQAAWNAAFAKAYVRLSLLGVANINSMTDCTKVLPSRVDEFTIPSKNTTSSSSVSSSASSTSSVPSTSSVRATATSLSSSTFRFTNSSTPVAPTQTSSSSTQYTTSTIYSTNVVTITEKGSVKTVTSVIPVSTTVCPYENGKPVVPSSTPAAPVVIKTTTTPSTSKASTTPAAPVLSTSPAAPVLSSKVSTTPAAPVLSSKPKACYTVTVTTTVY